MNEEEQISLHWSLEKIVGLQELLDNLEMTGNKDWVEYKRIAALAIFEARTTLKTYDRIEAARLSGSK